MSRIARGYLRETRRPVYTAALLLPFFVVYHAGTILFKTTYINGADALIIRVLSLFSVHSMFASAVVLLGCFLFWQWRERASWKVDGGKLMVLFMESVFFALLLFVFFGWLSAQLAVTVSEPERPGPLQKIVLYCGAGIYEELVFRGMLLGALFLIFTRVFHLQKEAAVISSVVLATLMFSAFHYIGPVADPFSMASFIQRALGGLYFSVLFSLRGFGVAAAAHALYDMLVGVLVADPPA